MASRLNPYLSFDGTAREAMEFYEGVFGGTLTMNTFGDLGPSDGHVADQIMHAQLETPSGFTHMGADNQPDRSYQPGNTMAVSLSGDDGDELRGYFNELAEGGSVSVLLEQQMWGDEFRMCTDRFGVEWMVNIAIAESSGSAG